MEAPPFPVLPADLYQRIQLLQGEAKAVLIRELKACWLSCIAVEDAWPGAPTPRPRHDPSAFFPPFVKYGVALFDTFPTIWLEMDPKPSLSDFLALIRVPLQVRIAEEIAPYWPAELADKEAFNVRSSERGTFPVSLWEEYMWASWKRLTKQERAPLEAIAEAIVRALRNGYRDSFADVLMISLAERAEYWSLEGLRKLTAGPGPLPAADDMRASVAGESAGPGNTRRSNPPISISTGRTRVTIRDRRHGMHCGWLALILGKLQAIKAVKAPRTTKEDAWDDLEARSGISKTSMKAYGRGDFQKQLTEEFRLKIEAAIRLEMEKLGLPLSEVSSEVSSEVPEVAPEVPEVPEVE